MYVYHMHIILCTIMCTVVSYFFHHLGSVQQDDVDGNKNWVHLEGRCIDRIILRSRATLFLPLFTLFFSETFHQTHYFRREVRVWVY